MALTYRQLREHLIAVHGYTDEYFDEDYAIGGPIRDLSTLRWLHQPYKNERGHRDFEISRVTPLVSDRCRRPEPDGTSTTPH